MLKIYCCCSVTKSCPTLCNLMYCRLPGSSVHGILQARTLEWVNISDTMYYNANSRIPRASQDSAGASGLLETS